ncbi:MAG: hypothetical protein HY364_01660 [Candidatus Aenigmarchaeota archaeon]|nr:hypothetical protein [Candidatus Aenigmarchaeota archaeon]
MEVWRRFAWVPGILALVALYALNLLPILFLAALSLATSFVINRIQIRSLGVEFALFTSVIAGIAYGPWAGALTALALMSFHIAVANYIGPYIIWVIPEYVLAGFLAGFLQWDPVTLGVSLALMVNAIGLFFTFIFNRNFLGHYLPYAITNVIFNFLVFRAAAHGILSWFMP